MSLIIIIYVLTAYIFTGTILGWAVGKRKVDLKDTEQLRGFLGVLFLAPLFAPVLLGLLIADRHNL